MTRLKDNSGFTLMELLVAISILSLLTTFIVASYAGNEQIRILKQEAGKILSGLQKTENMAITGQVFGSLVPTAYEFSLSNCDSETNGCSYNLIARNSAETKTVEKVELKNLSITIVEVSEVVFRFTPPRGRLEMFSGDNKLSSIKINIANDDAAYCLEASAISGRTGLSQGECKLEL